MVEVSKIKKDNAEKYYFTISSDDLKSLEIIKEKFFAYNNNFSF